MKTKMTILNNLIIREYSPDDSLEELTLLLHSAYKQLADMNLKYLATHQTVETTKERIERGSCFIAELDSAIVGLINYYPPNNKLGKIPESLLNTAWMGQFGVLPHLQKQGIGRKLVDKVEKYAVEQKVNKIALDTAEPAKHLIDWYTKLGYIFHSYIQWDITNYRSVIMVKEL